MSDDDDLGDRLRRTFARVADGTPVGPPPALGAAAPNRARWVLAAAAVVAVVALASALVLRGGDESVQAGPSDEASPPTSTPATVGADGRIVARGTDGALSATATATVDGVAGRVVVDVHVVDEGAASAAVSVAGDALPEAATTVSACDGDALDANAGFTLGASAAAPAGGGFTVVVRSGACRGSPERAVELALVLPALSPATGTDGPASPALTIDGDARGGVSADGVDGCLAEVLVDWGDRSPPTSLDVPSVEGCPTTVAVEELAHDYAPGEYAQRVTVTTVGPDGSGGQVAFVERRLTIG